MVGWQIMLILRCRSVTTWSSRAVGSNMSNCEVGVQSRAQSGLACGTCYVISCQLVGGAERRTSLVT